MTLLEVPQAAEAPLARQPKRYGAWVGPALLAIVVAGLTFVHAFNLFNNPSPTDEEGTYTAQAWALIHLDKLAPYTYWYDHPPLGWMLLALWRTITKPFLPEGPTAVATDREFMLVIFAATAVFLILLARRLDFSWLGAGVAVVIFGLSPLAVYLQRLVELDNIAVFFLVVSLFFAADRRRRLGSAVLSALALAASVLSVETAILYAPVVLYLLWRRWGRETRTVTIATFLVVSGSAGFLYLLYAISKNEFIPGPGHVSLLGAAYWQLVQRVPSGHIYVAGTVANQLLHQWMSFDPVILVLIVAGAALGWLSRSSWPFALALLIGVVMSLRNGYLPVTYPVELLPFAGLAMGGIADTLVKVWRPRSAPRATSIVLVIVAMSTLSVTWVRGNVAKLFPSIDQPALAAEHWMAAHGDRNLPVLVGDSMWVDLVHDGWQMNRVVWFYKINTDPEVEKRFPAGWRDMGYVIVTPGMRASQSSIPFLPTMIAHSRLLASFGAGGAAVAIYRVHG